jgi:3alpha(or 20beta)-hydroxysteroid dehydrogenase
MGKLEGQVAIVTGAAAGQGEAHARLFVAEGARVLLVDVLDDLGEKVAAELGDGALYLRLDVSNPDDWKRGVDTAVSRFGGLDILVNNAAVFKTGLIENQSLEDYMAMIMVNQVGCWLGMKAAIPAMKARGGGVIINTSSTQGFMGAYAAVGYTASKFAVRGMTKCAAMELGQYNIRVNSVHPGAIDTPMLRSASSKPDVPDFDSLFAKLPIPRVGRPEEVAKLMLFLATDATYSTGSEFIIDGGSMTGYLG